MRRHSTLIAAAGLWAVLCGGAGSAALAGGELGGRPFDPPGAVTSMPDEWVSRPVTHATPEPVDLALALDQQLHPALTPLIEAFARERSVRIATQSGTCGISSGALAEKTADMGGFCCPPNDTDRLPGLRYHTLGIGALAIIAHPDNPLDSITVEEARGLFGGKYARWSDLPVSAIKEGPEIATRAVARLHCKLRPGHWRLILDTEDDFGTTTQEVGAITDMIMQVAKTPSAIGYETLWHVHRHADQGAVKVLKIGGVDPRDGDALAQGRYPFYRVFNITTWADAPAANALADALLAYLQRHMTDVAPEFAIVDVDRLHKAGWMFEGDELVGEPR